uniref:Sodium/calcium exchanger 1 n=1 Tax=Sphaerodactylus townsendi TaxID=933632 RepID=A0ACB8G976_9SAUR
MLAHDPAFMAGFSSVTAVCSPFTITTGHIWIQIANPQFYLTEAGCRNGGDKILCASFAEENDEKQPLTSKEEEERRIAEMGRPILGEHTKLEVIIEESYEFKNTVDKLIKKTNLALVVGTNSWREQFIEAITVSAVKNRNTHLTKFHDPFNHHFFLQSAILEAANERRN